MTMTESTDLDARRGMAAQKATEKRRKGRAVALDQSELMARREEMERHLFAAPAADWPEATEKTRYLLTLLSQDVSDPRIQRMVGGLLADLERLSAASLAAEPER